VWYGEQDAAGQFVVGKQLKHGRLWHCGT
jgi:hypothetical protein